MTDDATNKAVVDGLFPIPHPAESSSIDERAVHHSSDQFDAKINALSSSMTRNILRTVQETPCTPPEIRDRLDTSLQNTHYHLRKLDDVDLVEPAGTAIHRRGGEMTLYRATSNPLMLVIGDDGNMEDDADTPMKHESLPTGSATAPDQEWTVVTHRPVTVEARGPLEDPAAVETERGSLHAKTGDYIIRGPCSWRTVVTPQQFDRLFAEVI